MYIIVNVTSCPDYSGVLISGGSLYRAVPLYTPTRNSTWPHSATEIGLKGQLVI